MEFGVTKHSSRRGAKSQSIFELSFGDAAVGQVDQLIATGAHLDVDRPQRRALELQARGLMVVGAAEVAEF
jgi:hypothetical protein